MPVLAAMLLWIVGAPDSFAQRSGTPPPAHAAAGHAHARHVAPNRARIAPRVAYWAAPLTYAPSAYYAVPQATQPARPALYYVPPLSANAPPFSFDGSPAVELDWGWQRVSLQQLVAEVRAKREAGSKP